MGQSESTDPKKQFSVPKRSLTTEFFVGLFMAVTAVCVAYLAVGLGGLSLSNANSYNIYAQFDNVSGLKYGASVEVAGVPVGEVTEIALNDPYARVTLNLNRDFQVKDDDIASIRTKGIIGDRYVKISRGASDIMIGEDETMSETESVVDIEDIIGKIVHSLGSDDDDDEEEDK